MATGRRKPAAPRPNRVLPANGRTGPAPECPVTLGEHGRRWWKWAWSTPQATAWGKGVDWTAAMRAQVADSLGNPDLNERDRATWASRAQSLDKDLGLSPAGMKSLGWSVAQDETPKKGAVTEVVQLDDFRAGLG